MRPLPNHFQTANDAGIHRHYDTLQNFELVPEKTGTKLAMDYCEILKRIKYFNND